MYKNENIYPELIVQLIKDLNHLYKPKEGELQKIYPLTVSFMTAAVEFSDIIHQLYPVKTEIAEMFQLIKSCASDISNNDTIPTNERITWILELLNDIGEMRSDIDTLYVSPKDIDITYKFISMIYNNKEIGETLSIDTYIALSDMINVNFTSTALAEVILFCLYHRCLIDTPEILTLFLMNMVLVKHRKILRVDTLSQGRFSYKNPDLLALLEVPTHMDKIMMVTEYFKLNRLSSI